MAAYTSMLEGTYYAWNYASIIRQSYQWFMGVPYVVFLRKSKHRITPSCLTLVENLSVVGEIHLCHCPICCRSNVDGSLIPVYDQLGWNLVHLDHVWNLLKIAILEPLEFFLGDLMFNLCSSFPPCIFHPAHERDSPASATPPPCSATRVRFMDLTISNQQQLKQ